MKSLIMLTALSAAVILPCRQASAVIAEDFGFGALKVDGQPVTGQLPLLVVRVNMDMNGGRAAMSKSATDLDALTFSLTSYPSLNGYFLENSHGAFLWRRLGVLDITLNAAEVNALDIATRTYESDGRQVTETGYDSRPARNLLMNYIVSKTAYNWAALDTNGDNILSQSELTLLIYSNNGEGGAHNRSVDTGLPGTGKTLRSRIAYADHRASFTSFAHELSHSLGTYDLYGGGSGMNSHVTLMGPTIFGYRDAQDVFHLYPDNRDLFHLDPWHKMQLGWLRPRIFNLGEGGTAVLRCAQATPAQTAAEGPVILWSPARGGGEFFMVEYRARTPAIGGGYDSHVSGTGMAVWHILQNGNHAPAIIDAPAPREYACYHEGAPNRTRGDETLWNGVNAATPELTWLTGQINCTNPNAMTGCTPLPGGGTGMFLVNRGPMDGGNAITMEWRSNALKWLHFSYAGFLELGTFNEPFKTLPYAVANTPRGATLNIKPGSSPVTGIYDKPMILTAPSGGVLIGQ